MIGARYILLALWPVLWLCGSVHAQSAAGRLAVGVSAISQIRSGAQGSPVAAELVGIHHRAVVRVQRRVEFRPFPTGPLGDLSLLHAEVPRRESGIQFHADSVAPLGLANGWQFLLRAAAEPRAPSLVS